MVDPRPSAPDLRQLLITLLDGAAGGGTAHWTTVIGSVERHSLATHPACNWTVDFSGSARDREMIEHAIKVVRQAHPLIRP